MNHTCGREIVANFNFHGCNADKSQLQLSPLFKNIPHISIFKKWHISERIISYYLYYKYLNIKNNVNFQKLLLKKCRSW